MIKNLYKYTKFAKGIDEEFKASGLDELRKNYPLKKAAVAIKKELKPLGYTAEVCDGMFGYVLIVKKAP